MIREIINIDEEKCTGCGECIPSCVEGALQIIDGKCRLISELLCDGLGACIGHCPEGAMTIEKREAEPYDERQVLDVMIPQGENTVIAHLRHLQEHGELEYLRQAVAYLTEKQGYVPDFKKSETESKPVCANGGCPGSKARSLARAEVTSGSEPPSQGSSELRQWPVQLQLINPQSSFFQEADLLICADCVPFAFADFHQRFVKGRITITFCPKLDPTTQQYIQKLAQIFSLHSIKSITILRMEVPCCGGTTQIVEHALRLAQKNIIVKEYTVSIRGEIV